MNTNTRIRAAALGLALLGGALTACTDSSGSPPSAAEPDVTTTSPPAADSPDVSPSASTPRITRKLDSIAVLGHSGATGTVSDPANPARDAVENSWATGDNPAVKSIYWRLLATHPAMKGHNYNAAVNGATVDDLGSQLDNLLTQAEILPDVVLIQVIDNDIACDGADLRHARTFGRTLSSQLTRIRKAIPGVQIYLVSPWASVELWTDWARHIEAKVVENSGSGPCDVFDAKGRPRPAGMRSMQRIVDAFRLESARVCATHPRCYTSGDALESFRPENRDLSADLNHLSVAGHAKYASLAWRAFPEEIKDRK